MRLQKQSSPIDFTHQSTNYFCTRCTLTRNERTNEVDTHPYANRNYLISKPCQLAAATFAMANAISINFTVIFSFTNRTNPTYMYRSAIYGIIVISIILTFHLIQKSIPNRPNRRRETEKKIIYCFNLTVVQCKRCIFRFSVITSLSVSVVLFLSLNRLDILIWFQFQSSHHRKRNKTKDKTMKNKSFEIHNFSEHSIFNCSESEHWSIGSLGGKIILPIIVCLLAVYDSSGAQVVVAWSIYYSIDHYQSQTI